MRSTWTFLALSDALLLAVPASAGDCVIWSTHEAEIDTGRFAYDASGGDDCTAGAGEAGCTVVETTLGAAYGSDEPPFHRGTRTYVDSVHRCPTMICPSGPGLVGFFFPEIWIFQETNGIDGLQRYVERIFDTGEGVYFDDTCHGMIQADTLIF